MITRAALGFVWLSACAEPQAVAPAAMADAPIGDAARGRELLATFECNRCHEGTGLEPAPAERRCVGCHQSILDGTFDAPAAQLEGWRDNLHSLNHAPSLAGLGGHLRREWITTFLLRPHDVRPGLAATLPRLSVSETQAADLAAALTEGAPARERHDTRAPDLARASALLERGGCYTCHTFGGLDGAPQVERPRTAAVELAPDLRFTRERMDHAAIVRWLRDPSAVRPGTLMPKPALDEGEIELVAAFLRSAPLGALPARDVPERLPILTRAVTFEEVRARLLHTSCWHCHADPDFARGDGGPGNTGGFGYAGRRVDLSDHAGVSSGYLDGDGERRSLFALDGDTPHLVRVLMARHHEEAGTPIDGVTGMPLGLPPVPLEDIQLVETWIAQGRPL